MEAIDLGLSVLWAETNLGAASKSDVGTCYSWAYNEELNLNSIYTPQPSTPIYGNPKYDVCTRLGEGWRLPTKAEFEELISMCDHSAITIDDKKGCLFKNKENGKNIFLPATPDIEESAPNRETALFYWTGERPIQEDEMTEAAFALEGSCNNPLIQLSSHRWTFRYAIRPVKVK